MTAFEHETFVFWRKHPGEKAKLMGQAIELLWDPRSHETQGRSGKGTWRDTARRVGEPVYLIPIYVLALVGLFLRAARSRSLALLLLAYNTAAAMVVRRDDALPGAVRLPARAARRGGGGSTLEQRAVHALDAVDGGPPARTDPTARRARSGAELVARARGRA